MFNFWRTAQERTRATNAEKVRQTSMLITQQFEQAVREHVNTLLNLKNRLEMTDGYYSRYWSSDAKLIVNQNSSLMFIEWIDSNKIIRMVEPEEGNKEAIGLDISKLDYRNADWDRAAKDSVLNFTHFVPLVQGRNAFLVDAPVYYQGKFQGTITAGMNFTIQFDEILTGLDQYHVNIYDSKGTEFYSHGDSAGIEEFAEMKFGHIISILDGQQVEWRVTVEPNAIFSQEEYIFNSYLNLGFGLLLSLLIALIFYSMQTAFIAQKSSDRANDRIRALIESSPMAIYAIDSNGIVRDFWNKAAEEMLGWSQKEVIGNFIPHLDKGQEQEFLDLMNDRLEKGEIRNKEIIRTRKDGSRLSLRLNMGRMVGAEGEEQQMLVILEDITKESEYKRQLEESLHEKDVLLSEVHHRVKNNLAIIVGLIELQKSDVSDEKLRIILKETQNRIYSISGVHELLYNTDSFTEISFEDYAKRLIDRIRNTFDSDEKDIRIDYQFETKNLNINQAIPLGLLLNELVTNSFKHAFKDRDKGKIGIQLNERYGLIKATYTDNGIGIDEDLFNESHTLGVTLIKTLLSQLRAEYTLDSEDGFRFAFMFDVKERGAHSNL